VSRRSLAILVGVYVVLAVVVGLAINWIAALVVAFLSLLVLAIGFGALVGGDWFRDASAGRFRDRPRD
jgi:hypothetical protein